MEDALVRKIKLSRAIRLHPNRSFLVDTLKHLKKIYDANTHTPEQIFQEILDLKLEFKMHLWITGNFKDLMSLKYNNN